jgi:ABC-2 type transport system permease protein
MKTNSSLRRLWALSVKECYQIIRDPSSVLVAFVLPIVMLIIFGYGVNLDSSSLRVGLVNEDSGVEAQRFAARLVGSPYMNVIAGSRSDMEKALVRNAVRGFVVIPADFTSKLQRPGSEAPLQIITDGSEPNVAAFVRSYVRGAWEGWQQQLALARGEALPAQVNVEPRFWFNPSAESRNFLIPGSITIIMTVVGALLTSLVVAREWERGTMEALLSTPVTRRELLLSKLIPYYLLGMGSMLVCVGVAVFLFGIPFRGSLAMLVVSTTFFLMSALGQGLLLSTLLRNQFLAAQAALNLAFLPAVMLSGFIFEISSMPAAIRLVTYLFPARYFVTVMQTLFQAGDVPWLLWRNLAVLAFIGSVFLGLTALKTRRHLD